MNELINLFETERKLLQNTPNINLPPVSSQIPSSISWLADRSRQYWYLIIMDLKKRGKAKKERDDDDSSSSYEHVPKSRVKSERRQAKSLKPTQPVVSKEPKAESKSKEAPAVKQPPKEVKPVKKPVEEQAPKRIIIQPLNKNKAFADILNQANKEPQFLMKLRNLLSGCNRTLEDKKIQFKKKWDQLRYSNCTQMEYIKRETELKKNQIEEVREIKEDIMTKLGYSSTKGFETKQNIIDTWKEQNPSCADYELNEADYQKHRTDQLALLEMLMKQSDLVSQEYNSNKIIKHTNFMTQINPYDKSMKPNEENRQNQTEMDLKFNYLDSEENPQNVQFFFTKQFNNLNFGKIFENPSSCFNLDEKDKFFMSKKTYSWLLDSKSDEIYSNEKFQGETYDKYTKMLKSIHDQTLSIESLPQSVIEDLLQIATYILNSIHYYQKFKLKCPVMHPIDLMYVLEKIKNKRCA